MLKYLPRAPGPTSRRTSRKGVKGRSDQLAAAFFPVLRIRFLLDKAKAAFVSVNISQRRGKAFICKTTKAKQLWSHLRQYGLSSLYLLRSKKVFAGDFEGEQSFALPLVSCKLETSCNSVAQSLRLEARSVLHNLSEGPSLQAICFAD